MVSVHAVSMTQNSNIPFNKRLITALTVIWLVSSAENCPQVGMLIKLGGNITELSCSQLKFPFILKKKTAQLKDAHDGSKCTSMNMWFFTFHFANGYWQVNYSFGFLTDQTPYKL
ncbi:hypothetical protein T10_1289 [Trichinella papuae]|uniref:Uncharacterized protein n=1 Tax=Trichinella papuae TaxID=268474 RepID=A0A0V1MRF9_9BILA|nr:hypothetical protein T10_1289 [Trichinella papuae]